jgi:peptidoglycan/xylan/chitin deacetylase (PgdA/CDA1 family)
VRFHRSAPSTAAAAIFLGVLLLISGCGAVPPGSAGSPPPTSGQQPSSSTSGQPSGPGQPSESSGEQPTPTPTPTEPAVDCKQKKCFALTFDDGPSPDTTPQLLKILKKHKVRATFFQLGSLAKEYPEIVKQIHDMGSEVANHSWDHDSLDKKSPEGAYEDIKRANDAIEKGCGCKVRLMRPPFGAVDRGVDKAAKRLGVSEIFWDIDTEDWKTHDPYDIRSKVVHGAGKNRISLMHDIHQDSVDAVEDIIEKLEDDGYTLVTVSEMIGDTVPPGKRFPKSWANYGR